MGDADGASPIWTTTCSDARTKLQPIYALLGAKDQDNFVFTSSGAEATNHAFVSTYYDVTRHTGKNHFILSKIDEAPPLMVMERLEQMDCVGKMVSPNNRGQITVDAIADAMSPRTALVS